MHTTQEVEEGCEDAREVNYRVLQEANRPKGNLLNQSEEKKRKGAEERAKEEE